MSIENTVIETETVATSEKPKKRRTNRNLTLIEKIDEVTAQLAAAKRGAARSQKRVVQFEQKLEKLRGSLGDVEVVESACDQEATDVQ